MEGTISIHVEADRYGNLCAVRPRHGSFDHCISPVDLQLLECEAKDLAGTLK